ncbi:hypothetical protein CGCS363_v014347 [Colletotrichum siamense]|uniref:uncharacterized protein n=1 Tax=Colletotrichum siamense TaxID=690259 RepID=UPI001872A916|nr:uncharacterized protein CGCS363_v014347 [Colletotrichum siamense]KAF5484730.1 hypothetical protein CGCS363_v014347 [Colletotrichum siamense]
MDAAPFYKKLGFAKVGGFRISIPAKNGGEETYEEVCTLEHELVSTEPHTLQARHRVWNRRRPQQAFAMV